MYVIFLYWVIRVWIFALILVPNPLVLTDYHIKFTLPAAAAHSLSWCCFFKAGLLGCEAVLSSMALMQASSIAAPKKMMSPLGPASGHGSAQRDAQDRGMQGHMVLPTSMTCPPLVRRHLQAIDFRAALIDRGPELAVFLPISPLLPSRSVWMLHICSHPYVNVLLAWKFFPVNKEYTQNLQFVIRIGPQ